MCGQAAGSGEHVFPAALGGRRINKKIYCTKHDNGYSSLVADLASQVDGGFMSCTIKPTSDSERLQPLLSRRSRHQTHRPLWPNNGHSAV